MVWDGLGVGVVGIVVVVVGIVAAVVGIVAVGIALADILAGIRLAAHIRLLVEQLVLGGHAGLVAARSMRRVWVVERKKPDP